MLLLKSAFMFKAAIFVLKCAHKNASVCSDWNVLVCVRLTPLCLLTSTRITWL